MSGDAAFVRETRDHVRALSDGLIALERDPDDREAVDDCFRAAHTIKGNAGAAGLTDASDLAHALEDLLDAVRAGDREPTRAVMDDAFDAVDALEAMVEEVGRYGEPRTDPEDAIARLRDRLDGERGGPDGTGESGTDETGGGGTADGSGDLAIDVPDPDETGELTAEEALENASAFDDLDGLAEEIDDEEAEAFADLEGSGTFDEVLSEDDDGSEADGHADDGDATGDDDTPDFEEIRSGVDLADPESLQAELDEVQFGGLSPEDDYMAITELMDLDPKSGGPAAREAGSPGTDAGPAGTDTGEPVTADSAGDDAATPDTTSGDGPATPDTTPAEDGSCGGLIGGIQSLDPEDPEPSDTDATGEAADSTDSRPTGRGRTDHAAEEPADTDPDELSAEELLDVAGPSEDDDAIGGFPTDVEMTDPATGDAGADVPDLADVESAGDMAESGDDGGLPVEPSDVDLDGTDLAGAGSGEAVAGVVDDDFDHDRDRERSLAGEAETRIDPAVLAPADRPDDDGLDDDHRTDGVQSLTVDVDRADDLLELVEELLTTRFRLERAHGTDDDEALGDAIGDLRGLSARLEGTVKEVRLVPVEEALGGLARIVRDVSREADKRVNLETVGEDVRLDRSIVDAIGDPLVHVVRNAVDHGIEPPAERERAGKDPEGTVTVRAERSGDLATIVVEDDGRGIDHAAVRDQAVEQGIVDPEAAAAMEDDAVGELLFEPGFSTADSVTSVSGRGVGMDVVATTVERFDGDVTVESTPGEGTTVRVELPVTVAADDVLFVTVGEERYGIRADAVDHVEPLAPARLADGSYRVAHATDGGDVDGAADSTAEATAEHPFVPLSEVLSVPTGIDPADGGVVVHAEAGGRSVAFHCDDVVDWKSVVVQPYADLLGDRPTVSGAAILGDGSPVNLLDLDGIGG